MKMWRFFRVGFIFFTIIASAGLRFTPAQKPDEPPPQVSTDDFPRARDLTGSELLSGSSIFRYPKKPVFKLKRTIPRRTTRPVPSISKSPAPSISKSSIPEADIWKRLGVTIWRLESDKDPEPPDKAAARLLVQEAGSPKEYTPRRVPAETTFKMGDRVRLTFESPTGGYLYVFDREIHADGSLGEPYQIFPTLLARGGNGIVQAGALADVPAQTDALPYFTLKSGDPNWLGELLTVVVSDKPLSDLTTADKPSPVSSSVVESLESKYLKPAGEYEQEGSAGRSYTKSEKDAGSTVTMRQLTQDDPFPQTVYQVRTHTSDPLVLNLRLAVK